jgi:hypothetical protein
MNLRMWLRVWLVGALVATPASVRSSWEGIIQVAQPLLVDLGESGVWITSVPYLGYDLDMNDRPAVILHTVAPNIVSCDGRSENRNMAALVGLRFSVDRMPSSYGRQRTILRGDTLQVSVAIAPVAKWPFDESEEDVYSATLWCGLLNARQAWPAVRFVEYTMQSSVAPTLAKYQGVYSLADVDAHGAAVRWSRSDRDSLTGRCTRRAPATAK